MPPIKGTKLLFIVTKAIIIIIKALVAWRGGMLLTEGKIGVLSVSSLFFKRVGVYVGVCVCICTHTHTLHRWGTRMSAQGSG